LGFCHHVFPLHTMTLQVQATTIRGTSTAAGGATAAGGGTRAGTAGGACDDTTTGGIHRHHGTPVARSSVLTRQEAQLSLYELGRTTARTLGTMRFCMGGSHVLLLCYEISPAVWWRHVTGTSGAPEAPGASATTPATTPTGGVTSPFPTLEDLLLPVASTLSDASVLALAALSPPAGPGATARGTGGGDANGPNTWQNCASCGVVLCGVVPPVRYSTTTGALKSWPSRTLHVQSEYQAYAAPQSWVRDAQRQLSPQICGSVFLAPDPSIGLLDYHHRAVPPTPASAPTPRECGGPTLPLPPIGDALEYVLQRIVQTQVVGERVSGGGGRGASAAAVGRRSPGVRRPVMLPTPTPVDALLGL
jgi:hypothetical protein